MLANATASKCAKTLAPISLSARNTYVDLPPDLIEGANIINYDQSCKNVFDQHDNVLLDIDKVSYLQKEFRADPIIAIQVDSHSLRF